jgi:hypothetical protein
VQVALEHVRHPVGKHPRSALGRVDMGKDLAQRQVELGGWKQRGTLSAYLEISKSAGREPGAPKAIASARAAT